MRSGGSVDCELLSCPFCGKLPVYELYGTVGWKINCLSCGISTPDFYDTLEAVAEFWNTRK